MLIVSSQCCMCAIHVTFLQDLIIKIRSKGNGIRTFYKLSASFQPTCFHITITDVAFQNYFSSTSVPAETSFSVLNTFSANPQNGQTRSNNSSGNCNPPKWSNTLKQFVGKLPTNFLPVFDHFVGLVLKQWINFWPVL